VRLLRQGTSGTTRVDFIDLVEAPISDVTESRTPQFALQLPRPNPAGQTVEIGFSLASSGDATLRIHDVGGRLVNTLLSGATATGFHQLRWDLRDGRGQPVEAGVYFIRLAIPGASLVRRVAVTP
jgi:hypothetical protein